MERPTIQGDGFPAPPFLYGTAWKEDETQRLVELAVELGFRGIDTANQRRHYHEAAVGQGIAAALRRGLVSRSDLFLQTKFTFRRGQDERLPYDPSASLAAQVEQSFDSSLQHLGTDRIDSFVLHGPTQRTGLAADDWSAWQAMESIHDSGGARWLGVSNVTLEQLRELCLKARVRPRFVQNRCYAVSGWDRAIRKFCTDSGLTYQGFSLLTANRDVLGHAEIVRMAKRYGRTASQIVFRFALDVGMLPLTGTSSAAHIQEDLNVFNFRLEPAEISKIENIAR
jgi:diketogulonate reductase-like aldo/keto reductase